VKHILCSGSSVSSRLGRGQTAFSLFPSVVADRWSEYVFVLIWFLLGILGLIIISVLFGILDHLFLGTSMMGGCGSCGIGRLSASG